MLPAPCWRFNYLTATRRARSIRLRLRYTNTASNMNTSWIFEIQKRWHSSQIAANLCRCYVTDKMMLLNLGIRPSEFKSLRVCVCVSVISIKLYVLHNHHRLHLHDFNNTSSWPKSSRVLGSVGGSVGRWVYSSHNRSKSARKSKNKLIILPLALVCTSEAVRPTGRRVVNKRRFLK